MMRNTYLRENIMFTNIVNATSFGVGKEKIEKCQLKDLLNERVRKGLRDTLYQRLVQVTGKV